MTSPTRLTTTKRQQKHAKAGIKRKKKLNRDGSTASAEKLFQEQK